jgi:hypothetical protein
VVLAQGAHGVEDRGEHVEAVVTQLDGVLPPAFRIVEPGGFREGADRVHRGFAVLVVIQDEGHVRREVEEADLAVVVECPAQRHPLRREHRHGVEVRRGGRVDGIHEPGDRWSHAGRGGERRDRVEFRRALDQHDLRVQLGERGGDRAGRARAVMADAENVDPVVVTHTSSRHAR